MKNKHNQIIEGLLNGDTIEDLLKEKDFILITTCCAQEAAKQQWVEIMQLEATGRAIHPDNQTNPPLRTYIGTVNSL